jgi:hypothetical protein
LIATREEEEEKNKNMVRCISFDNMHMKCNVEDRGLKDGNWNNKLLWKLKTASVEGMTPERIGNASHVRCRENNKILKKIRF